MFTFLCLESLTFKSAGSMSNRKPVKINRRDYARVLITETLPYETPIIFSNGGLYDQIKSIGTLHPLHEKFLKFLLIGVGKKDGTIPLIYKIRKNSHEFRRLSLVHPRAQWKMKEFYEKYEKLILHYCSVSPASIRAPHKVAGSFYKKSSWENLNQYKNDAVSTLSLDELTKHSPSFFTYRNFDRLYKFFDSEEFFSFEKKYKLMLTLDVSKCFDSIYTHSLSWAIKDKEFTKKNKHLGTFSQAFDDLMMFSNHDETNGIVIGPEVSRVFAEIILQRVDCDVIERLKKSREPLEFDDHYTFRRYVDDVFIFAKTESIASTVYECYADALTSYNLQTNSAKATRKERPFISNKSRLIHEVGQEVNAFLKKFLDQEENSRTLKPRRIQDQWALTRSFVASIRAICSYNEVHYDELSSYLIAVLSERIKAIVGSVESIPDEFAQKDCLSAILVLLDVIFFLYGVSPSVAASYKLCSSMLLSIRFAATHLPNVYPTLAQRIYELAHAHLIEERHSNAKSVKGFLPLETLNVLLAMRELGDAYLLPEEIVSALFEGGGIEPSYFQIMCCLFYVKDSARHAELRKKAISAVEAKLEDLSDLAVNTEKAYLLLDILFCPYVPDKAKRQWIRRACKSSFAEAMPVNAAVAAFLGSLKDKSWQVSWTGVDLLSMLEKKELKQVYQ